MPRIVQTRGLMTLLFLFSSPRSCTSLLLQVAPRFPTAYGRVTVRSGPLLLRSVSRHLAVGASSTTIESSSSETLPQQTALLWLKTCLRVHDNEALTTAASLAPQGLGIVYVWKHQRRKRAHHHHQVVIETASQAFERQAILQLDATLRDRYQSRLTVLGTSQLHNESSSNTMAAVHTVAELVAKIKPTVLIVDASSSETTREELDLLEQLIGEQATRMVVLSDHGRLLPWTCAVRQLSRTRHGGKILRWPAFLQTMLNTTTNLPTTSQVPEPLPAPNGLPPPLDIEAYCTTDLPVLDLQSSQTVLEPDWAREMMNRWGPVSEQEAWNRCSYRPTNLEEELVENETKQESNMPSTDSGEDPLGNFGAKNPHHNPRVSPYLRWGILSPRQAYHASSSENDTVVRKRDLLWRDWSQICFRLLRPLQDGQPVLPFLIANHTVDSSSETLDSSPPSFVAWCMGRTGAPLVDAGMRQLWVEGWMPRRIRLLAASCLVEGLGQEWYLGRDWFAHTLIDHDPVINELMWQNAGFVGVDLFYRALRWEALPQGEQESLYVQKWCSDERGLKWPSEMEERFAAFSLDPKKPMDYNQLKHLADQKRKQWVGRYKKASRVANTGVRVVWNDQLQSPEIAPPSQVWGVGKTPIHDL